MTLKTSLVIWCGMKLAGTAKLNKSEPSQFLDKRSLTKWCNSAFCICRSANKHHLILAAQKVF